MLDRIRNAFRALFPANVPVGTPTPAPVEATHTARAGITATALSNILAATAPLKAAFVEYKRADLPPGVVPARDKAPTGEALFLATDSAGQPEVCMAYDDGPGYGPQMGWLNGFNSMGCGLAFPGYPYLAQLSQVSEYRAPSEVISTEMTRKWLKVISKGDAAKKGNPDSIKPKGEGEVATDAEEIDAVETETESTTPTQDKADKIAQIEKRLEELKVRDKFRKAAWQDGLFGRSQIYVEIKGQESDLARQKPLTVDDDGGVGIGSLKNLQVIEPYWTTPYSYNAAYPERPDFYIPDSWYVMGRKTHTTRLLSFVSREVPDLLKPSYNFGGISMTQLMEPYVTMWLRTRKSVNDLINIFSITTLATDMNATLNGTSNGSELVNRATVFTQYRDNKGLMLINKGTEEMSQQNSPLSTLDKLQAQSQEHMAAPCHIPLIKLFGVVPTGLNATGEGEIQVWYDFVKACQENLFGPNFEIVLKLVQLDLFGEIDPDIWYEFVALDEPTAKEKAEMRKSDADAATAYINAGVVDPNEVREKLQRDPESGYDNLQGEAPGPPALPMDPNAPPGAEGDEDDADEDKGPPTKD